MIERRNDRIDNDGNDNDTSHQSVTCSARESPAGAAGREATATGVVVEEVVLARGREAGSVRPV